MNVQPMPLPGLALLEDPPGMVAINKRCSMQTEAGRRLIAVCGILTANYALGDGSAEAMAMVNLIATGAASQIEVSRAFGLSTRQVRRYQRRSEEDDLATSHRRGRQPGDVGVVRIKASAIRMARKLKDDGVSTREIARRIGVCEKSVRKLLNRMGWQAKPLFVQPSLPGLGLPSPLAAEAPVDPLQGETGEVPQDAADTEIEPVFVKNLESVQGDERDIIYFSITYGPDLAGVSTVNFGPLNRDGGERRLNVAITRARQELRVFSSLRAEQINLARTAAVGVRDLKHFLDFADRGAVTLAEEIRLDQGGFESPFEEAVAAALGRRGWQVRTQVGVSAFRIDLGVVHPDAPGAFLAGVECDGAIYHRSATARDRDKLREQVLGRLGWEILRVWSTDWWIDPAGGRSGADVVMAIFRGAATVLVGDATVERRAGSLGMFLLAVIGSSP